MGVGRKILIGVGVVIGIAGVAAGSGYAWAASAAASKLSTTYDVHRVEFPIPFPLTAAEVDSVRAVRRAGGGSAADVTERELTAIATERAVARGKHLASSFYACAECHGQDFGGGVMVDDPAMGRLLGPNLTTGAGSRTLTYTAADGDRMVRHGVKPDGHASPMPSRDFFSMSDRELSDLVSYIRSLPPVDKTVPAVSLGPVSKILIATGRFPLSAQLHPTRHEIAHAVLPPPDVPDVTLGRHLALHPQNLGQRLADGHAGVQRVERVLEHHRRLAPQPRQRPGALQRQDRAVEGDMSRRHRLQPQQGAGQREAA